METVKSNIAVLIERLFFERRFCTAASDRKLRLFTSDLQDKNEFKVRVTKLIFFF